MVVWKQNSDFVLRWINFHQQACLAQQAQTEIKHYKRLGFSIPEKQVWMHSWPFLTSSQLPPPRASNFTKHKSRGSTCQSLAGDHKVVSENKHQMSFCCPFTRFSPGGKVSVLEDINGPRPAQQLATSLWPFHWRWVLHQLFCSVEPLHLSRELHHSNSATLQILVPSSIESWGHTERSTLPSPLTSLSFCHMIFLPTC